MVAALCRVPGVPDLVSRFIDRRWAGTRSSAVARTRVIDDAIRAAVDRGIEQLVILGAGFDSRAYRLEVLKHTTIFEVDHPSTFAKKQTILQRALPNLPRNVRFVPTDFHEVELSLLMEAAGYSRVAPTFILWEGVTPYLTEAAVDATLRWSVWDQVCGSSLSN